MNKRSYKKHGLTNHKLYVVWMLMKARCYRKTDTSYKDYGGRGIIICDEWLEFLPFYSWCISSGWKEGLTIDRINNNGNYEPINCRFITLRDNIINRRMPKNNTSGYRGVHFNKKAKKWQSSIRVNNKHVYIGCFTSKEDANQERVNYIVENNLPKEYL